jgi:hypothetical protein
MRWLKGTTLLERAVYCVRSDELDRYRKALDGTGVRVLDVGLAQNLGEKREIIANYAAQRGEDKFVMCDDDVMLYIRKSRTVWNLRYPQPWEVDLFFEHLEKSLDNYAMVGVSAREGNNRMGVGRFPLFEECIRAMRIYGFRTEDYLSIAANRLTEMADIDTTLQFLRSGRKNAVYYYWANGQPTSNLPGGCSNYRTVASHEKICHQLQALHPDFVRLRQKRNKSDQHGFGTRAEVTISWKRAYESSQTAISRREAAE